MKRYRVLSVSFDSRPKVLSMDIKDHWEKKVKDQWIANRSKIRDSLIHEYGAFDHEQKIENFVDLGSNPFSLISFHNAFLKQCRDSFVIGSYYPALVATCTLGERILNRLILQIRDYFKNTEQYKKVYKKESFDNWSFAVSTLEEWEILLPDPAQKFRELEQIRHRAIHFNPETDTHTRATALEAIHTLQSIVESQFQAIGAAPWYIPGAKGESFVARKWEQNPFVKEIVIPSCTLVGPKHTLEHASRGWIVHDDHEYSNEEISDEEFLRIRNAG